MKAEFKKLNRDIEQSLALAFILAAVFNRLSGPLSLEKHF